MSVSPLQLPARRVVLVGVDPSRLSGAEHRAQHAEALSGSTVRGVLVTATSSGGSSRPHRVRVSLAQAQSYARSWRAGADPAVVWGIKSSAETRAALRSADVILSVDPAVDAALALVPDLTGTTPLVPSDDLQAALSAMVEVPELLAEIVAAEAVTEQELNTWASRMASLEPQTFPLGAELVAAAAAALSANLHWVTRAKVVSQVLDLPRWSEEHRLRTGLAARRWSADLTLDVVHPDEVNAGRHAAAVSLSVSAALEAADARLGVDDVVGAVDGLTAAADLLFHRARHAEVSWSPLMAEPADHLGPLLSSSTWRALLTRSAGTQGTTERSRAAEAGRRPRVLVLTGAYGNFHRPVVEALRPGTDVQVWNPCEEMPALKNRLLDDEVLSELAGLIAQEEGSPRLGRAEPSEEYSAVVALLRARLAEADVVLSDWTDRVTVWASHLCPPTTRLVVRVHSLDLLDPWFHLVRWDRVDHVVAVSEPMASLARDLLEADGAEVPVTVVANLVAVGDMDRPKEPSARTTLGMVAWSRKVKDPHWALDLLEREPTWRLVLIGPSFPAEPSPMTEDYVVRFRERLEQPSLAGRVDIVGHTDDVAGALERVGVILSSSLREGMPVGLFEGASSGAVPVVRDWPMLAARGGARKVVPPEWVVDDLGTAEARIRSATSSVEEWERQREKVQAYVREHIAPEKVAAQYRAVVLGAEAGRTMSPEVAP